MTILVLCDHADGAVKGATLSAVTAAGRIGGEIHLLVAGDGIAAISAQAATIAGVTKVIAVDHGALAHPLAEPLAALVVALASAYGHIVIPATTTGKNVAPRIAALLDVSPVSDVIDITAADTFVRPIFAGNALATVQSSDAIKVLTVRPTAFAAATTGAGPAPIAPGPAAQAAARVRFVGAERTVSERPDLAGARVVVSGGRGLGSAENFAILDRLADTLGGAVGASRAAVDSGFAANDAQVGQTGKIVAPDLYIAIGISGAIQHLAGMKDSKVIVAINKDAEAPIFQIADYGLVADLFKAVPELTEALGTK